MGKSEQGGNKTQTNTEEAQKKGEKQEQGERVKNRKEGKDKKLSTNIEQTQEMIFFQHLFTVVGNKYLCWQNHYAHTE